MTEPNLHEGGGQQALPRLTNSFAFVVNVGRLVERESFVLAEGHLLRRANAEERQVIRTVLQRLPLGHPMHLGTGLWELPWPDLSGPLAPLPEDEWRYFVISFAGMSDTLSRIEEACDLGPLDLEVGFTIHAAPAEGFAMQSYPARLFHVLEGAAFRRPHFFVDVTAPQVDTTRSIAEGLATYDHALLDLRPSIAQLRSLKALQHGSALRFLGYFAILEALLTHLPDPKDPYDSITRQVKKKVTLLNNRWQTPLGYAAFGGASSDTIWKAMYAYRSRLAHGSIADFASRDLQVLGDRERPLKLLMDTVKATMRYALVEPRLLVDLKDC